MGGNIEILVTQRINVTSEKYLELMNREIAGYAGGRNAFSKLSRAEQDVFLLEKAKAIFSDAERNGFTEINNNDLEYSIVMRHFDNLGCVPNELEYLIDMMVVFDADEVDRSGEDDDEPDPAPEPIPEPATAHSDTILGKWICYDRTDSLGADFLEFYDDGYAYRGKTPEVAMQNGMTQADGLFRYYIDGDMLVQVMNPRNGAGYEIKWELIDGKLHIADGDISNPNTRMYVYERYTGKGWNE
jgi:hypothetical protein